MVRKNLPKYEIVKDYIIDHISGRQFRPHDRIPSESELAEALDVSSITVRKALSDLVNEGMIYRVRGKGSFVADRKSPDGSAASRLVVFIISGTEIYDSSYMQIIKGIQSLLTLHDYRLVIEFIENNVKQEDELIRKINLTDYSGLLIYSSDPNAAKSYLKLLKNGRKPFVMLDRFPNGIPVNCVVCNNQDGAYEATEYLLGLGHRHIGFAAYDYHLSSEVDRYNGYRNALADSGLEEDGSLLFLKKELDYDALLPRIRRRELTALFCVNDRKALEAVERLTALGVRIPEEISVMGFDDFAGSKFSKVPLTTVRQDFDTLGSESAKLLLELINDNAVGSKKIMLPTSLVIRESTAPSASP
ncbi:GntR family transcriptional regulator [Paenibacillus arenilitoris]|uniref:GntR family transcriptional regulator n=1 Tax=Paenibacillus arenilitoris TaxID=2772299 RepID=A0A927H8G7_9BACL|nr:GntR family transcriptional regulator [Paenibacillus arenilitoris]MBD2872060.1 GntR family transcriptional regulator [Paenibacillus arenilitoris]